MPSVIYEVEDAIGKRKREFNPIDERDIEREKEMQMKLAAASQYSNPPTSIYDPFNQRQILPISTLTQRISPNAGTKRGRFLPSPKETTTFPGSPTHNLDSNPFSSVHMDLDPLSASSPLYNTPVAAYASSILTVERPPEYNPTATIHSLQNNIRVINQGITQNQMTKSFISSHLGTNSPYTYSPDAVSKAAMAAPKMNLNPCHICQRRPLQKKDLDSYADCEGCSERCCWICVRECLGSIYATRTPSPVQQMQPPQVDEDHEMGDGDTEMEEKMNGRQGGEIKWPAMGGHRSKVCSRCCVEKGKEGEVRCLGCLRAEEQG